MRNQFYWKFSLVKTLDARSLYQIIDVREPNELEVAQLTGKDIINLPLSSANEWSQKIADGTLLDASKPTLCMCHHGMRSLRMANFLGMYVGFK